MPMRFSPRSALSGTHRWFITRVSALCWLILGSALFLAGRGCGTGHVVTDDCERSS